MSGDDKPKRGEIVPHRPSQTSIANTLFSGARGLFGGTKAVEAAGQHEVKKVQIATDFVNATQGLFKAQEELEDLRDTREDRQIDNRALAAANRATAVQLALAATTLAEAANIEAEIKKIELERRRQEALTPPTPDQGPSRSKLEKRVALRQSQFDELSNKLAAYRSLPEDKIHELPDAEYHQVQNLEYQQVEAEKALRQAKNELEDWIIENEA